MIRSRVDLPAPLSPTTPILAPWKKLSEMSLSTCFSGGCVREARCMVKMYSADTSRQVRDSSCAVSGGRRPGELGGLLGEPAGDRRRGLTDLVELGGRLLVPLDVADQRAGAQLEGVSVGRVL